MKIIKKTALFLLIFLAVLIGGSVFYIIYLCRKHQISLRCTNLKINWQKNQLAICNVKITDNKTQNSIVASEVLLGWDKTLIAQDAQVIINSSKESLTHLAKNIYASLTSKMTIFEKVYVKGLMEIKNISKYHYSFLYQTPGTKKDSIKINLSAKSLNQKNWQLTGCYFFQQAQPWKTHGSGLLQLGNKKYKTICRVSDPFHIKVKLYDKEKAQPILRLETYLLKKTLVSPFIFKERDIFTVHKSWNTTPFQQSFLTFIGQLLYVPQIKIFGQLYNYSFQGNLATNQLSLFESINKIKITSENKDLFICRAVENSSIAGWATFKNLNIRMPFFLKQFVATDSEWQFLANKKNDYVTLCCKNTQNKNIKKQNNDLIGITARIETKNILHPCIKANLNFLQGSLIIPYIKIEPFAEQSFSSKIISKNLLCHSSNWIGIISGSVAFKKKLNQDLLVHSNLEISKACYFLERDFLSKQNFTNQVNYQARTIPISFYGKTNIKLSNPAYILWKKNILKATGEIQGIGYFNPINMNTIQCNGNIECYANNLDLGGYLFEDIDIKLKYNNHKILDPIINFHSSCKIKKYNLNFYGFGVKDDLFLNLHTDPYLTQEQAYSLFLTGCKDNKFGFRQLLSNSVAKLGKGFDLSSFLNNQQTTPPKLKFFPSITSATGPEVPIQASLLINLSDKLTATVEKRLNDKDDLKLKVEYSLSENVVFKLNRSKIGLLDGELIFRLKF